MLIATKMYIIYVGFEAQKGFYTPLGIIYVTES